MKEIKKEEKELEFDILQIDSKVKKENKFEEGGNIFIFLKKYLQSIKDEPGNEALRESEKYFAHIKKDNYEFIGGLNKELKKESFWYEIFSNGDIYLGKYNKNKKEGFGIYFFKEKNEFFVGEFKDNKKDYGLYYQISKINNENLSEFSVGFIKSEGEKIKDFILYENYNNEDLLYKGLLNENGKKTSDNAKLFKFNKDFEIFFGKIENDEFKEGRFIKFNSNENNYTKFYYEHDNTFNFNRGEENDEKLIELFNKVKTYSKSNIFNLVYKEIIEVKKMYYDFEKFKDCDFDIFVKNIKKLIYEIFNNLFNFFDNID